MNDSLLYESDKEIDYFKYGNDILNDSNLSDEEKENIVGIDFRNLKKEQMERIYKVEKASGVECYFIRQAHRTVL